MPEAHIMEMESRGEIDYTRQRDWLNPIDHPHAKVVMVGGGGIGSATSLTLSKLGVPYLTIIDFDKVEAHNVPNQFFALAHVQNKSTKAGALASMCEMFGASKVKPIEAKLEDVPDEIDGIVVSGLDSMEARHNLWGQVKMNPGVEKLVCARLGGQNIVIFVVDPKDPDDIEYYEEYGLFSDEEGEELPCTARGIFDVSNMVAGLIGRQVRLLITDQKYERTICYNHESLSFVKG